jgi:hypothetical protein
VCSFDGKHGPSRQWSDSNFVSISALNAIQEFSKQMERELHALRLPKAVSTASVTDTRLPGLLGQLAVVALYPNVGRRRPGEINFTTVSGRKCKLSSSSVNGKGLFHFRSAAVHEFCCVLAGGSAAQARLSGPCPGPAPDWIAFQSLTQARSIFMANSVTSADALTLLLLCANVDLTVAPGAHAPAAFNSLEAVDDACWLL